MADLSITAANVAAGSNAITDTGTAGATVLAGQTIYVDTTTNTVKLADANLSLAAAAVTGISLHGSLAGQPIKYQTGGDITIGATVAVGTIYVLSATAGGIAPAADLVSGWRTSILGVATSATVLAMRLNVSGVAVP